jgi:hypothetical protein
VFAVFADHTSAGAWLMFNTGPQHCESIGEYRGDPLYHASLSPTEYESLVARFGFEMILHVVDDVVAGGRTSQSSTALARIVPNLSGFTLCLHRHCSEHCSGFAPKPLCDNILRLISLFVGLLGARPTPLSRGERIIFRMVGVCIIHFHGIEPRQ